MAQGRAKGLSALRRLRCRQRCRQRSGGCGGFSQRRSPTPAASPSCRSAFRPGLVSAVHKMDRACRRAAEKRARKRERSYNEGRGTLVSVHVSSMELELPLYITLKTCTSSFFSRSDGQR